MYYIFHTAGLVDDTEIAPAERAFIMSSLSDINPPAITETDKTAVTAYIIARFVVFFILCPPFHTKFYPRNFYKYTIAVYHILQRISSNITEQSRGIVKYFFVEPGIIDHGKMLRCLFRVLIIIR